MDFLMKMKVITKLTIKLILIKLILIKLIKL